MLIDEIENEGFLLARTRAIQARKCLDGLNTIKALVHVHRMEKRLIESRLVFVGRDQDLVIAGTKPLRQSGFRDRLLGNNVWIHPRFGIIDLGFRIVNRTAEGNQRMDVQITFLLDVSVKG
jgi:hypothetical protein